jgi:phospholipid/cholesterol/gamma-HCH transport system substrate-binding protein
MRTGAEITVGLITLLAIVLLLIFTFYIRGYRATAVTYKVCVIFDDARGLQRGDPVRMVGVKIGQVHSVEITLERRAMVTLSIDQKHELYDNYKFQIGTAGLIQERFVEVIPGQHEPYVNALTDGVCVEGVVRPDLSDLMEAGSTLLVNLNRTSRRLDLVLGDEEILSGVRDALRNFSQLADSVSALTKRSEPEIISALGDIRSASADLGAMADELRSRITEGTTLDNLEEATQSLSRIAAKADRITTDLAGLTSDANLQQQLRATVSAVSEAALSAKKVGADLEALSGELRKAAPAVPRVAQEARDFADASAVLRQRLKPPEITAAFDVLYSPEAERSFSSGRLNLETSEEHFLRFGIDDIGEESNVNIQLGERQRRAVLRYGLVRSNLGIGLDFDLPREITLSLDVFDPNNVRGDLLADVPFVLGRSDWSLLAGVRDVGDEAIYVGGIRLKR